MHAHIKSIPARKQRYNTVGDWQFTHHDGIEVRVTEQADWRHEFLVGLHELIEAALCKHRGISEESVTEFDVAWQGDGEPGDDPAAPYHKEHGYAEGVEMMMATQLSINWDDYCASVLGS